MKKKYLLIFTLLMLPFSVKAASVAVTVNCPSSAKASSTISCSISAKPTGSDLKGLQANYSITGGSYDSISANAGWVLYSNSAVGFSVSGNSAIKENTKVATLKLKMPSSGSLSIKLNNVIGTDSAYKTITGSANSVTVRVQSNDNNLSALSLSSGSLSPVFNSNTTSYSATVNTSSVVINATKSDSNAKISGTGTKKLVYGKNTFKVVVTSESGIAKTYTIVVNRPDNRSTNNYLKSLSLSNGSIKFNKNTNSYNVEVESNITSVKVNAGLEDSKASFVSGYGARNVNLKYGKNAIVIKVKAENESVRTYTINVTRKDNRSTNNFLKSLNVTNANIPFDKETLVYNVSVSYDITRVEIDAVVEDSKAKVVVNNKDLVVGDNSITIVVTSENELVRTYTINVKRLTEAEKMSDNNNVSQINIFGHEYDFFDDVLEYEITIGSDEKDLLFNVDLEDEDATYVIDGNKDLVNGSVVTVKAISESGLEKEYKFNIKKTPVAAKKEVNPIIYGVGGFAIGMITMFVICLLLNSIKKVEPKNTKVDA